MPEVNGKLGRLLAGLAALVVIVGAIVGVVIYAAGISAVANAAKAEADANAIAIQQKADKDVMNQIHTDIREIRNDLENLQNEDVFSTEHPKKRFRREAEDLKK